MTEHDPAERRFAGEHLLNCRRLWFELFDISWLAEKVQSDTSACDRHCVYRIEDKSDFQTVAARASRPCVGCTLRTGETPVPLQRRSATPDPVDTTALPAGL